MHKSEFDKPLSTEVALDRINSKPNRGCDWWPVKTKCDNIVELGGWKTFLKVNIIKLDENGNIEHYGNDYIKTNFSIEINEEGYGSLEVSDAHCGYNITKEQLILLIDTQENLNHYKIEKQAAYTEQFSHYNLKMHHV
jgi:hypothetical protein